MARHLSRTITTRVLAGLWLLAWLSAPALAQPSFDLARLDAQFARARQAFNVPGLAVAIVKDGKVVFARGYGVRELGKAEPVDEHTIFGIASNTKAFTAALMAM